MIRAGRWKPEWRLVAVAWAVVLLGFALRIFRIGSQSLWYDETYAWWIASEGPGVIVRQLSPDLLPLHFLLVWGTMLLAGHSELAVRFSSLFFGVLSLPLFYQLLRQLGARWAAVAGTAILACSAFAVYYSQEARMEMLAAFMGIAAAYALLRALRHGRLWRWVVYGLTAAAGLYTFYFVGLVLLALNSVLVRRKPPRGWWLANAAAVIVWLPWLARTLGRAPEFLSERLADLGPPSVGQVVALDVTTLPFGITADGWPSGWPAALLLVVALLAAWRLLRRPSLGRRIVVAWALGPTIVLDLLAFVTHVYWPRYWLVALPGWAAVVALGFGEELRLARRHVVAALAGVCAAIFLAGTAVALRNNYFSPYFQRDDYRAAFALVQAHAAPDEAFVYDPLMQYTAVDYYGRQLSVPAVGLPVPLQHDLLPVAQLPPSREDKPATDAKLTDLTRQYAGFWLLLYADSATWTEDWLTANRLLVEDHWFGHLHLEHFRPAPSNSQSQDIPGGVAVHQSFGPLELAQARATGVQPGKPLFVDLLWQPTERIAKDYSISLQLFGPNGQRVAQVDGPPLHGVLPTSRWQPGWSYPDMVELPLPSTLAAGSYRLAATVYDSQQALAGRQQTILYCPFPAPPEASRKLDASTSAGWSLDSASWGSDGHSGLIVDVGGQVRSRPPADYTWFAHLLDRQGRIVSQDDHPPLAGTSSWQPGDRVQEVFDLHSVASATQLELGAYDRAGMRVTFQTDAGQADHLDLALNQPGLDARLTSRPRRSRSGDVSG